MGLLQQPIEKKLSSLLGMQVRFRDLKLSPFAGRLEAEERVLSDGASTPLSIRRIHAEVSVAKALAGQIVIKSLTIEGASVAIVRNPDGSLNLPKPPKKEASPEAAAGGVETSGAKKSHTPWQMEAQSIVITSSDVRFDDVASGYRIAAGRIEGDVRQFGDRIQFNFRAGQVARVDQPADFGATQLSGSILTLGGLGSIKTGQLDATLEFRDGLKASATVPDLSQKRASLQIRGPLDINKARQFLPANVKLPDLAKAIDFGQPVDLNVRLDADQATGVQIHEMKISLADVKIPLPDK